MGFNLVLMLMYSLTSFTFTKKVQITVTSVNCAYDSCTDCGSQIIVDNENFSPKKDGINILVIDPETAELQKASFHNTKTFIFEHYLNTVNESQVVIATSQLLCTKHKSINLRRQKSIINAFERFGATLNIPPISFRSGVYIFCKGKCSAKYPANIRLPFGLFRQTGEDPIWVSFTLTLGKDLDTRKATDSQNTAGNFPVVREFDEKYESKQNKSNLTTLLLSTIIPCVTLGLLAFLLYLYLKWKTIAPPKLKERKQLNAKAVQFCECKRSKKSHSFNCSEKSPESNRKCRIKTSQSDRLPGRSSKRLRHTSSMRLFQMLGRDPEKVEEKEDNFATYVTVDPGSYYVAPCLEADCESPVYKTPSNIKRHSPPKDLPPLCETKITPFIRPTKDVFSHEYASPSEVGFIKSCGVDGLTRDVKKLRASKENSHDSNISYDYTDSGSCDPDMIDANIPFECKSSKEMHIEENGFTYPGSYEKSRRGYLKLQLEPGASNSYKDLSFALTENFPTYTDKQRNVETKKRADPPLFSRKRLDKSSLETYSWRVPEYSNAETPEYEVDPKTIEDNGGEYITSVDGYDKYELETLLYNNEFWKN